MASELGVNLGTVGLSAASSFGVEVGALGLRVVVISASDAGIGVNSGAVELRKVLASTVVVVGVVGVVDGRTSVVPKSYTAQNPSQKSKSQSQVVADIFGLVRFGLGWWVFE